MPTKAKILIVDDDKYIAKLLCLFIEQNGYEIAGVTESDVEAVEMAEALKPDLVLMDIMLKDHSNGIDTAHQIHDKIDIPIIYITAYQDKKLFQQAKVTEPYGYIIKPFNERDLIIAIEIALQRKALEDKIRFTEKYAQNVINSSMDMIIAVDNKRRITEFNKEAEVTFGYDKKEVIGKHINFLYADPKEGLKAHQRTIKNKRHIQQVLNRRKNGEKFPSILASSILYDTAGEKIGIMGISRDISERLETEDKYRAIFEQAGDAIVLVDTNDGSIIDSNTTAYTNLGYTREEFLKLKIPDIEEIESEKEVFAHIKKVLENGQDIFETKHRTKNGEIRDIRCNLRIIRVRGHRYIQGIWSDITEQKQVEARIRSIANILESSINEIFIFNTNTLKFIEVNEGARNNLGYTVQELQQLTPLDLKPEFTKESFNELIKPLRDNQLEKIDFETVHKRKDGSLYPVEVHLQLSTFLGVPAFVAIILDISERKKADQLLKISEEKFRTFFEQSKDGIYISTYKGKVLDTNPACSDLFGYSLEEFPRISSQNLYVKKDDFSRFRKEIEKNGFVKDFRVKYRKKDGTEMFCAETAVKRELVESREPAYMGIIRDETEQVLAKTELEKALIDAQTANRVKSLFLANMSHEIRTPLNAILGFTDLIEQHTRHLVDSKEQIFFDMVKNGGQRLMRTVHSILDISQIEAGTFIQNPTTINLQKAIQQAISELTQTAKEKNLELTFRSTVEEAVIKADNYSITQALSNLLDNAVKYTDKGTIQVSLNQKKGKYYLQIKDTGIGMEPEYLNELYVAFSQESTGYSKKYQGIGLGMALTKRYLDLNNVKLAVKSKKGAGTTFTLIFYPAKGEINSDEHGRVKEPIHPPLEIANRSVLIVEDDKHTQSLIEFILKDIDSLLFAESVGEAKDTIKNNSIDLVLLDLSLKGNEDGLDFVRYLRKKDKWKQVPVIAITAHAFVEDRERSLAAGCTDYLAKPVKRDDLLKIMKKNLK